MRIVFIFTLIMFFLISCTKTRNESKALYVGSINGNKFSGTIGLVIDKNHKILSGYIIGFGGHPFMISKISRKSETTIIECPVGLLGKAWPWVFEARLIKTDSPEYIGSNLKIVSLTNEPTIDVLLIKSGITKALQ